MKKFLLLFIAFVCSMSVKSAEELYPLKKQGIHVPQKLYKNVQTGRLYFKLDKKNMDFIHEDNKFYVTEKDGILKKEAKESVFPPTEPLYVVGNKVVRDSKTHIDVIGGLYIVSPPNGGLSVEAYVKKFNKDYPDLKCTKNSWKKTTLTQKYIAKGAEARKLARDLEVYIKSGRPDLKSNPYSAFIFAEYSQKIYNDGCKEPEVWIAQELSNEHIVIRFVQSWEVENVTASNNVFEISYSTKGFHVAILDKKLLTWRKDMEKVLDDYISKHNKKAKEKANADALDF